MSSHIPRKAIEETVPQQEEEKRESSINLPIQDPDLINHVRFTAEPARKVKDYTIPSNVVAPSKTKAKKTQKKQKKKVSKL